MMNPEHKDLTEMGLSMSHKQGMDHMAMGEAAIHQIGKIDPNHNLETMIIQNQKNHGALVDEIKSLNENIQNLESKLTDIIALVQNLCQMNQN